MVTDSRALCALKTASNLSGKLAGWSFFLEEFQITLVHKAGATLQNADGLSRCASAGDSAADMAIQLESLEAMEEDFCYLDDMELLCIEQDAEQKLESEVISLNILNKLTKSFPCSRCNHEVGESKHKQCGACEEVLHVACLPSKPPVGYWFCNACAPDL